MKQQSYHKLVKLRIDKSEPFVNSLRSKRFRAVLEQRPREMARVSGEGAGPSPSPPPSFIFCLSFHFSRGQNRESRSSVFLWSETARKRLLRRLFVNKKMDTHSTAIICPQRYNLTRFCLFVTGFNHFYHYGRISKKVRSLAAIWGSILFIQLKPERGRDVIFFLAHLRGDVVKPDGFIGRLDTLTHVSYSYYLLNENDNGYLPGIATVVHVT